MVRWSYIPSCLLLVLVLIQIHSVASLSSTGEVGKGHEHIRHGHVRGGTHRKWIGMDRDGSGSGGSVWEKADISVQHFFQKTCFTLVGCVQHDKFSEVQKWFGEIFISGRSHPVAIWLDVAHQQCMGMCIDSLRIVRRRIC